MMRRTNGGRYHDEAGAAGHPFDIVDGKRQTEACVILRAGGVGGGGRLPLVRVLDELRAIGRVHAVQKVLFDG